MCRCQDGGFSAQLESTACVRMRTHVRIVRTHVRTVRTHAYARLYVRTHTVRTHSTHSVRSLFNFFRLL